MVNRINVLDSIIVKMIKLRQLGIFFFSLFSVMISCKTARNMHGVETYRASLADSISKAIDYQMANYPQSQYRDVYKNFMQDFFGPGHILSDTAASGRYLRYELLSEESFDGPLYEPTGYKGNFYRVNLSLVKDGIVPYEEFFNAFVTSVKDIVPPSGEDWMKIWGSIDEVIHEKKLSFPEEEKDRRELNEQFKTGDYIVHHSQRFNDSVHFHYRIISRDNFQDKILPYLLK